MAETLFKIEAEQLPPPEVPDDWEPEVKPKNKEKLEVVIDNEKIHEVLSTLLTAYQEKSFPYNLDRARVPQDPRHMPPSLPYGSVDHAMFLWNACAYMRGGIKSIDAVIRLARIYEERPDFYNCDVLENLEVAEIVPVLTKNGLGFQERAAKEWVENAKRLKQRFDGDPRNIFKGVRTYEDALEIIQNKGKGKGFVGFQEKMTSMIIYYLMDEDLIETFMFPIPVDLHVMRVSIANEMIKFPNAPNGTNFFTEQTRATLRQVYFDYATKHNINPLRLCDAVWMLSNLLCGKTPGNITLEPHGRDNRNGRMTYLIPNLIDIRDPAQQEAYDATCRHCPIGKSCTHLVPGKQNYVGGAVFIRGKRIEFPLSDQFDLFDA